MYKIGTSALVAVLFLLAAVLPSHGQVKADEFLAPSAGGPKEVKAPDGLRVEGRVVKARTAQDAINAAVAQNKKELQSGAWATPEIGTRMVQFPSGLGYVATGMAIYRVVEHPV